nr:hypothetical protein [Tanacetum cinerariifolium]
NNNAVDMNGTMDNLEERTTNLEMVFAYLKNKKMLERQENKPNRGSSMWSFRYLVNIEQLMHPLPEGWSIQTSVLSICLGEGEEDALVVINISEKVVKYNLILKTTTEIFDIGSNQIDDDDDDAVEFIPTFEVDPNIYEFILSLASV